ncbi:MAG: universal stress protein [Planctomycetia bacterium]|jgi:nucleotide-binding universal stress UspA family protein
MKWLPRKTVVVPFDFSEDAAHALETALEMTTDSSHIHVVHVLPVLETTDPGMIWETIDDTQRAEQAQKALDEDLEKRGLTGEYHLRIEFGDPGHAIVDYACEVEAGLIVVASHGMSRLRHLLLGSVAERVVRLAHCPVLVLKTVKSRVLRGE